MVAIPYPLTGRLGILEAAVKTPTTTTSRRTNRRGLDLRSRLLGAPHRRRTVALRVLGAAHPTYRTVIGLREQAAASSRVLRAGTRTPAGSHRLQTRICRTRTATTDRVRHLRLQVLLTLAIGALNVVSLVRATILRRLTYLRAHPRHRSLVETSAQRDLRVLNGTARIVQILLLLPLTNVGCGVILGEGTRRTARQEAQTLAGDVLRNTLRLCSLSLDRHQIAATVAGMTSSRQFGARMT